MAALTFIWLTLKNVPRLIRIVWILLRHDILGIVENFPVLRGRVPKLKLVRKLANVKGSAGDRFVLALKKLDHLISSLGRFSRRVLTF